MPPGSLLGQLLLRYSQHLEFLPKLRKVSEMGQRYPHFRQIRPPRGFRRGSMSYALSQKSGLRQGAGIRSMAGHIRLFGIDMDAVRMPDAVQSVKEWAAGEGPCRYVVTPNVDHAVMFQEREDLRQAYAAASLVLADGFPVVVASRLLGKKLPERVAGSDLAPALFENVSQSQPEKPLRVYLLGAAPGVAERAAQNIEARWQSVKVVGTYSPPLGFELDEAENERILALIAEAQPEVVLLGLGAPKQELWVHRHRERIAAKAVLCVGATIDFLAGERSRAPVWMRKTGLEWLHRVASEPRRLAKRYLRDAWIFPQLVWREWRGAGG